MSISFPENVRHLYDKSIQQPFFFLEFQMMKGVSESFSGRIGLVTLLGFSLREKYSVAKTPHLCPLKSILPSEKTACGRFL